jgi:hypothetical protein
MRSWKNLAVALGGLCGSPRGETSPAARWNVRTKLDRSLKPTSIAMSVIARYGLREQARGAAQA